MANQLTTAATRARILRLKSLSDSERRQIGLHLQAIHGGQAVQRLYRQRGVDGWYYARLARAKKRKGLEQGPRSRVLPIA